MAKLGRITAGWVLMFDPQPHTPAYFQELTPRAVISCARLPFLKMFFSPVCALSLDAYIYPTI